MEDANEQQFHAEVMAQLEQMQSDAEFLAWLDQLDSCGAPRPVTVAGENHVFDGK